MPQILKEEKYLDGSLEARETLLDDEKTIVKERWYPSVVDPSNPWQATDTTQRRGGQLEDKKYYLDGVEVSQEAYQAYIEGLAPCIQATIDFEEPNLSVIIAAYLLP